VVPAATEAVVAARKEAAAVVATNPVI
jgi:hypothetical protein